VYDEFTVFVSSLLKFSPSSGFVLLRKDEERTQVTSDVLDLFLRFLLGIRRVSNSGVPWKI